MKKIDNKIGLFILFLCSSFLALVMGVFIGVRIPDECNNDVALKGCEITAATVEEELEQTRYALFICDTRLQENEMKLQQFFNFLRTGKIE